MKINISHIAKLANLSLLSSEKSKLEKQLEEHLGKGAVKEEKKAEEKRSN